MRSAYRGGIDGGYGRQGGGAGDGDGGDGDGGEPGSGGLSGARASSIYGHPALKHDVQVVHVPRAHDLQPYAVGAVMSV